MNKFIAKHHIVTAIAIIIVIGLAVYISLSLRQRPTYNFAAVKKGDIVQAVSENGTVKAAQEIALSFQKSGNVAEVNVAAGDKVKKGQTLAKLDTKDASAAISSASAALQVAQANYEKILNGATSADTAVAQTALDNAKKNLEETQKLQDLLVKNSLNYFLNTVNPSGMSSGLTAVPSANNSGNAVVTISGTYTGTDQGQYFLSVINTGSGSVFNVTGLETTTAAVRTQPNPLGTNGLSITVTGNPQPNDNWTISIPNTQSPSYIPDYNAYNAALEARSQAILNAQNAVDAAQAALNLKQTPARPEDVAAASAQVATAQAMLQTAQNSYANCIITSPIDGTITAVNVKVGEIGSSGKPVINLISNQKFQVESYLSEADLGKVQVGDKANVTLDAYGSGTNFDATILSIDPAATMQNGVATYRVILEFNQEDSRIKSGMAANLTIIDQTHNNALLVPTRAVITKNNDKFLLKQVSGGKTAEVPVTTGISSLDGFTEILSGVSEGDQIVNFGN